MTFQPTRVQDLVDRVPITPEWLVSHLLPRHSLTLLAAYPKVGKSTLSTQLVISVSQGIEFLGCATVQGSVLMVVAEEMSDDVIRRLQRLGMGATDPIWLWTGAQHSQEHRTALHKWIVAESIALVVIDTVASYFLFEDEVDNSITTRAVKPYADLAHSVNAAILLVHHERKSSDDTSIRAVRGGSAIAGIPDLVWQLHRVKGGGTQRRLNILGRYEGIPDHLALSYIAGRYGIAGPLSGAQDRLAPVGRPPLTP